MISQQLITCFPVDSSLFQKSGPEVIKLFFMLNSAETKIYPAHKCSKCQQFTFYEQDKLLVFEF